VSKSSGRRILASPYPPNFLSSSYNAVSKFDVLRQGRLSILSRHNGFDSGSFQLRKVGLNRPVRVSQELAAAYPHKRPAETLQCRQPRHIIR